MVNKQEVDNFLTDFKTKLSIWGIVFLDDRAKNAKTLAALELTTTQRRKIISELKFNDYCGGPIQDQQNVGGDLWIFGKLFKHTEIYIKISMGFSGKQTICISFHEAEHPMTYPLT